MPDLRLLPQSALAMQLRPVRHGRPATDPGVTIALRTDLALATVMARKGRNDALLRRVHDAFGLELPSLPRRSAVGSLAFVWAGPGHWLACSKDEEGRVLETRLRTHLSAFAAVCGQSDGRAIIRVAGPRARDALAKGVPIDLHPRAFKPGDAAVTVVGHIGVHFWQIDAVPSYEFCVFRSFASSFWQWLADASAEFGVDVIVA
jgi:heterotetrameric sarcosine oxidase gamma subunit